jgi:ubiquitin-protein ligase
MSSAATRLSKELAEVGKDDKTSGVKAVPVNPDNPRILKGTIKGPEGTPYEGGIFQINIIIPKQYPFEPPKMNFHTKIWHPNISSQTGAICLVRLHGTVTTTGHHCHAHIIILTNRREFLGLCNNCLSFLLVLFVSWPVAYRIF